MSRATRITASALGLFAGFGGPEHGYFQVQQGHVRPDGLFISSIGPPCDPEQVWHLCEPAMTVIPSFLVTGIVAGLLGGFTMIWALFFISKRSGWLVMILLSVALLFTGGGLVPPLFGMVAGVIAIRLHAPPAGAPGTAGVRVTKGDE
jgi:hypothetical protein